MPNTKYYIIVEVVNNTLTSEWGPMVGSNDCVFSGSISSLNFASKETGIKCATFTTKSDFTNVICGLRSATGANETVGSILEFKIAIIEYQDGMENWDIPYFEGMQSVKMPVLTTTGKNLFDKIGATPDFYRADSYEWIGNEIKLTSSETWGAVGFNKKLPAGSYIFSSDHNAYGLSVRLDGVSIVKKNTVNSVSFTLDSEAEVRLQLSINDGVIEKDKVYIFRDIQLEEGSTATSYEPYKSNILTVNEDVELRGVGDVQDTLDLITGEKVERIGEVVLDGSQDGGYDHASNASTGVLTLRLPRILDIINTGANVYGLLSDKYASVTSKNPNNILSYNGRIMITKPISELESFNTTDKIKSFLSQNPITLQYPLATPVIKTVDLSVVDQDGNNTKLSTFDDITHVTLSSEGLIPEAELEVATKNEEVLNTMSLEMDDISAAQTTIGETSDEQSENVDATMIATTEIYEGLL